MFIWQIFDHMRKHLEGATTEASSWESQTQMKFPIFLVCDSEGYKEYEPFTKQPYTDMALTVDLQIENVLSPTTPGGDKATNYIVSDVPTFYNGICKKVEFRSYYSVQVSVGFKMSRNRTYHVFFMNPGTEFYLINQDHLRTPPMIEVTNSVLIEMWITRYFEKDSPCEEGIVESNQTECMKEVVKQELDGSDLQCVPYAIHAQFPIRPICNSTEALQTSFILSSFIMSKTVFAHKQFGCYMPCVETKFNVKPVLLGKKATFSEGMMFLYSLFLYEGVYEKKRYRLMDFTTIVASVGGSLSFLLGVSCFGMMWSVVRRGHNSCLKSDVKMQTLEFFS
ncbi:uncharacterized protein LOC131891187 [Tigriopus californicus]|uniref:uncharacterized protein LOC131891187 n=1 Tax=Tigriopus californicus TaxID=6832 RepID=UPI0027DA3490|nr:uncharacterized protein LOC131891187 [Tigriopus californicus]